MNTNDENNDILFSQASFRKDTYVKVNHRKDINVVEFSLEEGDNKMVIPFNLSLFNNSTSVEKDTNSIDNKNMVLNNINRANTIGRACTVLKNFLKQTMFKKLLESGEIDESEYKMRMGELLKKIK